MMNTEFQMLFKLSILHSYFEGDVCNCLQFNPAADTEELMKRFNFKIRNTINGFEFYRTMGADTPGSFFNYIQETTDQEYLEFEMLNRNDAFYLFTDFPVSWTGQVLYTSKISSFDPDIKTVQLSETLSEESTASIFGNLKIYFADILNYQKDKSALNFQINFKARSTQWQYYIIHNGSVVLDNPAIRTKSEIDFEGPENVSIESGEKALFFSSGNHLLSLSEVPKYKFDLVNNTQSSGDEKTAKRTSASKVIFKGLPNPDPARTGTARINNKIQVSSPIYIYV